MTEEISTVASWLPVVLARGAETSAPYCLWARVSTRWTTGNPTGSLCSTLTTSRPPYVSIHIRAISRLQAVSNTPARITPLVIFITRDRC